MKRLSIIFTLFLMMSCTDFIDIWEEYEIKKGKHHSKRSGLGNLVSLKNGSQFKFKARFTNSCLYTPVDGDINKLYGITDYNCGVHENSARFGWRHNKNGNIEIFAYWYVDDKRGFKKIGETLPGNEDKYKIVFKDNAYSFRFNELEFNAPRTKNSDYGIRLRLFPYFGGNSPAPNDMMIYIYEYQ